MRIVVAGGTGHVGRHLVDALADEHQVVVPSRSTGVDVTTGRGLDDALEGADAVVDVTNIPTQRRRRQSTSSARSAGTCSPQVGGRA
jgi:nucleoside-diphosphate-sugar epimerase